MAPLCADHRMESLIVRLRDNEKSTWTDIANHVKLNPGTCLKIYRRVKSPKTLNKGGRHRKTDERFAVAIAAFLSGVYIVALFFQFLRIDRWKKANKKDETKDVQRKKVRPIVKHQHHHRLIKDAKKMTKREKVEPPMKKNDDFAGAKIQKLGDEFALEFSGTKSLQQLPAKSKIGGGMSTKKFPEQKAKQKITDLSSTPQASVPPPRKRKNRADKKSTLSSTSVKEAKGARKKILSQVKEPTTPPLAALTPPQPSSAPVAGTERSPSFAAAKIMPISKPSLRLPPMIFAALSPMTIETSRMLTLERLRNLERAQHAAAQFRAAAQRDTELAEMETQLALNWAMEAGILDPQTSFLKPKTLKAIKEAPKKLVEVVAKPNYDVRRVDETIDTEESWKALRYSLDDLLNDECRTARKPEPRSLNRPNDAAQTHRADEAFNENSKNPLAKSQGRHAATVTANRSNDNFEDDFFANGQMSSGPRKGARPRHTSTPLAGATPNDGSHRPHTRDRLNAAGG